MSTDFKKPEQVKASKDRQVSYTKVGAISDPGMKIGKILLCASFIALPFMLFFILAPDNWTQSAKALFSGSEPVDKYTVLLNAEFNRSQEYVQENGTYNGFAFTDEISGVTSKDTIIMAISAPGKCVFVAYSKGQEFLIGEDTENSMCSSKQLIGFQNLLNKRDFENIVKV